MNRAARLALLCAAAALVVAVGYGVVRVAGAADSPSPTDIGATTVATAAPPTTAQPSGARSWRAAAEGFAMALTDTTGGRDAWLARIERWVSPGLAAGYAATDIRTIDARRFTRVAVVEEVPGATPTVRVVLRYEDGLAVELTVSRDDGSRRWVVTTAQEANPRRG